MRTRVSRILAVTLATAVTVTAMPSEAEAAFRSFNSVPKAVSQAISQAASQKEIRYFPVTLYDYDQDMINQAVYQEDKAENPNSRVLRGIYFSNGAPGSSYATWNTWTGLLTTNNTISSTQTSQKGYVYSGLVGSDMQNGNIHFTVSDGGISIIPAMISSTSRTNDYSPRIQGVETGVELLSRIIAVSRVNAEQAIWMPDSYEVQAGLVSAE